MLGNLIETGMYYLRTKAAVDAIKFTLNNDKRETNRKSNPKKPLRFQ
jgi:hypothetical protein